MNHNNLYLSIGSFLGSALSFLCAFVMNYLVMGVLGFVALVVSIIAGIRSIQANNRVIRNQDETYKHKSGGHR